MDIPRRGSSSPLFGGGKTGRPEYFPRARREPTKNSTRLHVTPVPAVEPEQQKREASASTTALSPLRHSRSSEVDASVFLVGLLFYFMKN